MLIPQAALEESKLHKSDSKNYSVLDDIESVIQEIEMIEEEQIAVEPEPSNHQTISNEKNE